MHVPLFPITNRCIYLYLTPRIDVISCSETFKTVEKHSGCSCILLPKPKNCNRSIQTSYIILKKIPDPGSKMQIGGRKMSKNHLTIFKKYVYNVHESRNSPTMSSIVVCPKAHPYKKNHEK